MTHKSTEILSGYGVPNPDLDRKIDEIRAEVDEACRPILEELASLERQIETMTIASRFSPTVKIDSNRTGGINPQYEHLTEAEFKRQELKSQITLIRGKLVSAAGALQDLKLEIDVTSKEM